jgi:hypothetical protein
MSSNRSIDGTGGSAVRPPLFSPSTSARKTRKSRIRTRRSLGCRTTSSDKSLDPFDCGLPTIVIRPGIDAEEEWENDSEFDDEDFEVADWSDDDDDLDTASLLMSAAEEDLDPYTYTTRDLTESLAYIEDLDFVSMALEQQMEIVSSIAIKFYEAGDVIVSEGDDPEAAQAFFLVLGTAVTHNGAEVEVVKKAGETQDGFIARLKRGNIFGQHFFLTNRDETREITARVPDDCKCLVVVGMIQRKDFMPWERFRCCVGWED